MNFRALNLNFLSDIRFWIVFFFILRLYGITNPPLDGASTWRQTDTLMIARNFYEHDSNILHPTLDFAGEKSGVVGSEFPILNYLIYLISLIFGFENWYGRIINLVITSIGTFFFYKVIKRYFGESAAFNASIVLIVSMWFSYSRNTLPDVFASSLCIIALYFACKYLEEGTAFNFLIYLILASLGCLSKISTAPILTTLAIPVLFGKSPISRKVIFSTGAFTILGLVYAWYFMWVPYLNSIGPLGGYYFMGFPFAIGIQGLQAEWMETLDQFFVTPLKYTGMAFFLFSLYIIISRKHWVALTTFLIPLLAFTIFVLKSGNYFYVNDYYPLVFVPIFAFTVGFGLAQIKSKTIATLLLVIVSAEGIANHAHVFKIRPPLSSLIPLEAALNGISDPNDLIAINSEDGNPAPMFCAHRKGWNVTNDYLSKDENITSLQNLGCKFIIILKIYGTDIQIGRQKVYDSKEFSVYKI